MSANIRGGFFLMTAANGTTPVSPSLPAEFDLKAVRLVAHNSVATNRTQSIGVATGVGAQAFTGWNVGRRVSGNTTASSFQYDNAVILYNNGSVNTTAAISAWSETGFSVTPSSAPGETVGVFYLAYGGSDVIADVRSMALAASATTTPVSVTAFGTQVPAYIEMGGIDSGTVNTLINAATPSFGVSVGTTEHSIALYAQNSASPSETATNYRRDAISRMLQNPTTERQTVTVAHDAGGYTLSQTGTAARRIWVLAICGINATVLTGTIPSSTGVQSFTSLPFRPDAVSGFGGPLNTSVGIQGTLSAMFGNAARNGGTTAQASHSMFALNGDTAPFDVDAQSHSGSFFRKLTDTTVDAESAVSAWGDDNFELNWSNADAVAGSFTLVALGGSAESAAAAAFHHYYRS